MGRLRTITEAHKYLKEQDPGTSVTPFFLRSLVYDGAISHIKAGKKFLIDIDSLEEQLSARLVVIESPETPAIRGMRPVSIKKK
ncbi:MAG TPA: hypothetical protein DCM45_07535 [Clostridiales bacterium]|nr:hypothetical protein [Clostridiales bacterium]